MNSQYSYSKTYRTGDKVKYQGDNFVALRPTTGHTPGLSDFFWKKVNEEPPASTANVSRGNDPDDDGEAMAGVSVFAAVEIASSLFGGDSGGSSDSWGGGGGGDFGGGGSSGSD